MITVSIVSHGHGRMIDALLRDLADCQLVSRIILTINVPEDEPLLPEPLTGRVMVLRNLVPKGFGANHNNAFEYCNTPYYCVLNPDIRLNGDPFPALLSCLGAGVALCAPSVVNFVGEIEDNARRFPGLLSLLAKLIGLADGRYYYEKNWEPFHPEWVAGMFMLFVSEDYAALKGFDENYFLYYEDVDLCIRLWKSGRKILLCPRAQVIHAAQRASHHDLRHLSWHLASMIRYFIRHWGRLPSVGAHSP